MNKRNNTIQKITKKVYYRIEFTLKSPLSIGSGDNSNTDRDIILNSQRQPYIPGSAIAGVVSHALSELYGWDEGQIKIVFGYINKAEEDKESNAGDNKKATEKIEELPQKDSRVIFYDARIENDSIVYTSVRDSIALDDYKTTIKGAKFDMEILEAGARFCTYVEQNIYDDDPGLGDLIPSVFMDDRVAFGGKSIRGYGAIGDVRIGKLSFDLTNTKELNKWLDFEMFDEQKWDALEGNAGKKADKYLHLELKQKGAISIRRYTTAVKKSETVAQPDFEQLTAHDYEGRTSTDKTVRCVPVIPGTSWSGAFRHRMKEFGIDTSSEKSLFGYMPKDNNAVKKRSQISFSESRLRNAKEKILSRNAIDRFSGGTKDGALFTEKTYYGGDTELVIRWHRKMNDVEKQALAATITDLHYGFLAVGGETSIGHGLFEIIKINGSYVTGDNVYAAVLAQIEEMEK